MIISREFIRVFEGRFSKSGSRKGAPSVLRHRFSAAFAFTYNKAQGMTRERVVIVLHKTPGVRLGAMTIEKVFVGVSRVRERAHLAIFPCKDADLAYLFSLEFPQQSCMWYGNHVGGR